MSNASSPSEGAGPNVPLKTVIESSPKLVAVVDGEAEGAGDVCLKVGVESSSTFRLPH